MLIYSLYKRFIFTVFDCLKTHTFHQMYINISDKFCASVFKHRFLLAKSVRRLRSVLSKVAFSLPYCYSDLEIFMHVRESHRFHAPGI